MRCCFSRGACQEKARELAGQENRFAVLQQQSALAAAELASCRAELANILASQDREAHAKDAMLSQLRAALAVEEAGKTGAFEQLRAAQSRAAQLEVCSVPSQTPTWQKSTILVGDSASATDMPNLGKNDLHHPMRVHVQADLQVAQHARDHANAELALAHSSVLMMGRNGSASMGKARLLMASQNEWLDDVLAPQKPGTLHARTSHGRLAGMPKHGSYHLPYELD